jgi:hypothetical protein
VNEDVLELPPAPEGEEVVFDYASLGLTLRSHPLALLRPKLSERRLLTAAALKEFPDGRLARACGIVTMRQQPSTSNGVVFVTLEDESGTVNLNRVAVAARAAAPGTAVLPATGRLRRVAARRGGAAPHCPAAARPHAAAGAASRREPGFQVSRRQFGRRTAYERAQAGSAAPPVTGHTRPGAAIASGKAVGRWTVTTSPLNKQAA